MADPGDNINNLGQGAEEIKGAFNEIKGVLLQISSILEAQALSTEDYAANLAEAKDSTSNTLFKSLSTALIPCFLSAPLPIDPVNGR